MATVKLNSATTYFVWAGSGGALSGLYHTKGKARLNVANGEQCYWSQRHRHLNPALRSFTELKTRQTEPTAYWNRVEVFGLMLKWYNRKTLLLLVRVSCMESHVQEGRQSLWHLLTYQHDKEQKQPKSPHIFVSVRSFSLTYFSGFRSL